MTTHTQQITTRLRTIEGHIRGVQRMVEADAYCIDIIKQTQAVERAIDKFNSLVLAEYLTSDVTAAIRSDQLPERERVVTSLLEVFHGPAEATPQPTPPDASERTAQRVAWLQQIEAQVREVQQLVTADADRVAIIARAKDVRRMLNAFSRRILKDHLNGCVTTAIRNDQPAERERMLAELLQVFDTTSAL
jgi:DNA-binding FrmR family transcriptional regulator